MRSGLYRRRDGEERIWLSASDIEMTMEDELRKAGVFPTEQQPAVDIERFIAELGVRMDQHADLDPTVLGQTEFYKDGPPKIFINRNLTGAAMDGDETPLGIRGRWRATVAHEGIHVLVHGVLFEINRDQTSLFQMEAPTEPQRLMRCLKKNVLFRGGNAYDDWREVQANMGMAALLMPQSLFRSIARELTDQHKLSHALCVGSSGSSELTAELARIFEVSKQAAGIRLQTLGILSPLGQYRLVH